MQSNPHFTRRAALAAMSVVAAVTLHSPTSTAHGYKLGNLEIGHPWTRATPQGARVAGGYLSITNTGRESDRLVAARFTQSGVTEIHEMAHENGIMKMRELAQGIEIRPGEKLELKPGGYHLMFIDLKEPLAEGHRIRGELVFLRAGRIEVEFKVEALGARGGPDHHDDHGKAKTQ